MNHFLAALVYIAFAALIAIAIWITHSALPLFALFFTPSVDFGEDK